MLVATTDTLPGFEITEVLGTVFGLSVRSRNAASQLGAGVKAFVGGELKGMTKNLAEARRQVIDRMSAEAAELGADAVVTMRFDTSELGGVWAELCAYGTAVRIRPVTPMAASDEGTWPP
jgi:uncharacterized protein YbjQ (UPF0145 family)